MGRDTGFRFSVSATPQRSLLVFLGGCLILAGLAVVYLMVLPSDPTGHLLGRYSGLRLALIGGPLVLAVVSGALLVTAARSRSNTTLLADRMFRGGQGPRLVGITGFSIAGVLSLFVFLVRPDWIESVNSYHLQRLLPYLVLPWALLGWFSLANKTVDGGVHIAASPTTIDALICIGLFALSFGARYPITRYALPYAGMWDEVVTYAPSLAILRGDEEVFKPVSGWGRAGYGEFLVEMTTVAEVVGFLDGMRSQRVSSLWEFVSPTQGVQTIWEGVHESGIPLQYPRTLMAFINSVAPVLVYVGLRRHLKAERGPALVGGLLLAVRNFSLILDSFLLPDPLATTIAIGIVLCGLEIVERAGGWWLYALSGVLLGLASGTVLRYLVLATVPLAAFALVPDRSRPLVKLAALGAGGLLGFAVSSPGFFTDTSRELVRMTRLDWDHSLSLSHRVQSLVYYVGTIVESLGAGSLVMALAGATYLLWHRWRAATLLLFFLAVNLWWLTPIQLRFNRHALVLYPVICLLVGAGIQALVTVARLWTLREPSTHGQNLSRLGRGWSHLERMLPWIIAILFALGLSPAVSANLEEIGRMAHYKTPQQQMTEFLQREMGPGDKVGILDALPFSEAELYRQGIEYERIGRQVTIDELRTRGITVAVGSDQVSGEYGSIVGTTWEGAFADPDTHIAEFGKQELSYRGYPKPDIYLFAVRILPPRD